jgi:IS1 family transposase
LTSSHNVATLYHMNKLSIEKRKAIISALIEGVGVNATSRLTGVGKQAILRLLADVGEACAEFHHERVRGLKPDRVECDEIWSFVFAKEKSLRPEVRGTYGIGDCWLWTAIDRDSKVIISYLVGQRTPEDARDFMMDLSTRITNTTTLSTDGLTCYPDAVSEAFGDCVHYGQVIKIFNQEPANEARYSPAKCTGCKKKAVLGAPRAKNISTSIVERSNLTLRSQNKRFARLTLGHSKKIANHEFSIALSMAYYNWCRPHLSLEGKTPAMAAGLTDRKMTIEDLIGLID